jgi:hypothetical protein
MWRGPGIGTAGVGNGMWFTLQWEVESVHADGSWHFDPHGGTQGSEGFDGGGAFFIENVLEELDSVRIQFFYLLIRFLLVRF